MSNPFDSILAGDMAFMNADVFGESIVLTRTDGRVYKFSAVIERFTPDPIKQADAGKPNFSPHAEFWIPSSLIPTPPDKQGDKFTYPTKNGDAAGDHALVAIMKQDAGGWLVRCR